MVSEVMVSVKDMDSLEGLFLSKGSSLSESISMPLLSISQNVIHLLSSNTCMKSNYCTESSDEHLIINFQSFMSTLKEPILLHLFEP